MSVSETGSHPYCEDHRLSMDRVGREFATLRVLEKDILDLGPVNTELLLGMCSAFLDIEHMMVSSKNDKKHWNYFIENQIQMKTRDTFFQLMKDTWQPDGRAYLRSQQ